MDGWKQVLLLLDSGRVLYVFPDWPLKLANKLANLMGLLVSNQKPGIWESLSRQAMFAWKFKEPTLQWQPPKKKGLTRGFRDNDGYLILSKALFLARRGWHWGGCGTYILKFAWSLQPKLSNEEKTWLFSLVLGVKYYQSVIGFVILNLIPFIGNPFWAAQFSMESPLVQPFLLDSPKQVATLAQLGLKFVFANVVEADLEMVPMSWVW